MYFYALIGGGFFVLDTSTATIDFSTFQYNLAFYHSAGCADWKSEISVSCSTLVIDTDDELDNNVDLNIQTNSHGKIIETTFIDTSTNSTQGIYALFSMLNGADVLVQQATTLYSRGIYGGGMYIGTDCSVAVKESSFLENVGLGFGGGLYSSDSLSVAIENCTFLLNTADDLGGGVYILSARMANVTATTFIGNIALNEGDHLYILNVAVAEISCPSPGLSYPSIISSGEEHLNGGQDGRFLFLNFDSPIFANEVEGVDFMCVNGMYDGCYVEREHSSPESWLDDCVDSPSNWTCDHRVEMEVCYLWETNCQSIADNGLDIDSCTQGDDVMHVDGTTANEGCCVCNGGVVDLGCGRRRSPRHKGIVVEYCSCVSQYGNRAVLDVGLDGLALLTEVQFSNYTFDFNNAHNGGALFSDTGTIYLESCSLHDNIANNNGGAIAQVKEAALDLWSTKLGNNTAGYEGGAVASHQGGTMVIYTSDYDSNVAFSSDCHCNAFYKDGSSGSVIVYNSTFLPLAGEAYPFNIEYASDDLTDDVYPDLRDGFLNFFIATECGSVLTLPGKVIDLSDKTMEMCSNKYMDGAAINVANSVVTLSACDFVSNHAYQSGGGAIAVRDSDLTILQSTLKGNQCGNNCGAFVSTKSSVFINDCMIQNNMAENDGGGIFAANSSILITRTAVSNNTCHYNGAGQSPTYNTIVIILSQNNE